MKKIIALALLALASCGTTKKVAPAQDTKLEKGLLWQITGNGITQPSYLYGTMHATCNATLDANILKALNETSQLYLEIDMDSPTMTTEMMGGIAMKNGVTISSLVSKEDFNKIDAFIKKNTGMSVKMLDTYKPLIISSMLLPKQLGCPMKSFELELIKLTKEQKEEIYGLETVQEQLAVFDNIPYADQVKDLLETANDDMAKSKAELQKMMELYETKDLNELQAFMKQDGNPLYSTYTGILLDNRNQNWIPKIEAAAKENPTFFGVGAAHLPGENGVIMLLRKKGYTVEAVK